LTTKAILLNLFNIHKQDLSCMCLFTNSMLVLLCTRQPRMPSKVWRDLKIKLTWYQSLWSEELRAAVRSWPKVDDEWRLPGPLFVIYKMCPWTLPLFVPRRLPASYHHLGECEGEDQKCQISSHDLHLLPFWESIWWRLFNLSALSSTLACRPAHTEPYLQIQQICVLFFCSCLSPTTCQPTPIISRWRRWVHRQFSAMSWGHPAFDLWW
jgi:hypothetical protein